MYAVIETGGKQYRVSEGATLKIEKIDVEVGQTLEIRNVLLLVQDDTIKVGNPYLRDVKVVGEVIEKGRDKKIIIFKSKRRKGYRKKQGHRQPYTKIRIKEICV